MRFPVFVVVLLVSAVSLSASDYYAFTNVKRVDSNLYSGKSGYNDFLVETSMCLHLTIGEDATVKWDGMSGIIVWEDNSTCDVKNIIRR